MEEQPTRRSSSADRQVDTWTWIILAGILVLAALVGVGALALTNFNRQPQTATGSQTAPAPR